jgi:soluble lytic murein transglycosylase-like protein
MRGRRGCGGSSRDVRLRGCRGTLALLLLCALTLLGTGCAGLMSSLGIQGSSGSTGVDEGRAHSARSDRWVALSRAGRNALRRGQYAAAEKSFAAALGETSSFHRNDARAESTLGNLARVAAGYDLRGRETAAARVMSMIADAVLVRGFRGSSPSRYEDRYRELTRIVEPARGRSGSGARKPRRSRFDDLIQRTSKRYELDPALVKAIVRAESNFEKNAISPVGAQGLMQLMPQTALEMGVAAPFNPRENIRGGVRYLKSMIDRYGKLSLALAAYNAGPSAVDDHGGVPPYPETKAYVKRVLEFYRGYRGSFPN